MDQFSQISDTIALSMGAAWGSGINLYATVLVLGILGVTENVVLPENLQILTNPMVMGGAGLMFVTEFIADKIPGVDTGWDAIHTFIRIPAGALMAAGAIGDVSPALEVTAAILGGGMTAGTHGMKAGSRALINTSPEPFTNWTASVAEDIAVVAGVWTALQHPMIFLAFLVVFILLMIWLLPKIWRGIRALFSAIGRMFGGGSGPANANNDSSANP
ncbi:DUF4126 domain-containing protein [Desulfonema ishimotonii]|uniref:DUF4126 domain-containing protein n=1 Tax=Desulfonema ishimotonii TaxID=45657 RepID=A0A401FUG1_9BACT|nr:DUF4126 domain-containing protein [Desulfonema ishimotonii]GBC60601.1 DUF4126 domain-containing protein [Desulfonema ishimotonii]